MTHPTDKRLFGVLQTFENLIIFVNDNTKSQNGCFIDANFKDMRNCIVKVFRENHELREFFSQCVSDGRASGIIRPNDVDFSRLKLPPTNGKLK